MGPSGKIMGFCMDYISWVYVMGNDTTCPNVGAIVRSELGFYW